MIAEEPVPLLPASVSKTLGWISIYVLLVIGAFNFPMMPASDLDPSWRMALGYFYENGLQFGRDVVFNYGPLGFVMGKTYSGLQFWSLIVGQLGLALFSAGVIVFQARRLGSPARLFFLLFFFLFGLGYEDALHMLVITILGFDLLRHGGAPWRHRTFFFAVVLAVYAQIKFTDLLLGGFVVLLACGYSLWCRRWREAGLLGASYVGAYLAGWLLLGQHLSNLPAYFAGSWQISEGWLWAMGLPAPINVLWKGLVVLLLVVGYAVAHVWINPDRPRAIASSLLLGAAVYLNWKHGFVRADGHMIGFFYCALLPLTAYPALLDDPPRFRRLHRWIFLGAMVLSGWALENTLPGLVKHSFGLFQDRAWANLESAVQWSDTRQRYREKLALARTAADLYMTRELAGQATIDVLGHELGVALFNRFNYQPRPVIQSYSTFNPALDQLNYNLYASARAPQFVLSKIQTIDSRLPTMDDPHVLLMLAYRYEYLRTEKEFGLWKLNPGPFDPAAFAPRPLRTTELAVNRPLVIEDLSAEPLWVKIDLQPSWLGKLRSFFYKPPQVRLSFETTAGLKRDFLIPLPQGRTGFLLNPMIEDVVDYMKFANSQVDKRVRSLTLGIAATDEKYFAPGAHLEFSALRPPDSGRKYFTSLIQRLFNMFQTYPVAYSSLTPVSESTIDGRAVAILHAPSQMIFDLPANARTVSGKFGMLPGTYTDGGRTDGAEFVVYWSNGTDRIELFRQYLNPMKHIADRGLLDFAVSLPRVSGGHIFLEVGPGPNKDHGWDWSAWTNIKIE
jgi:hypothetical protein